MSSAGLLPDMASDEWSPVGRKIKGKKKKRTTHLRAPGVVKPYSRPIVVVPLSPCPWYLQSVMVYASDLSCRFTGAGVGAALLRVLGMCQVVLL